MAIIPLPPTILKGARGGPYPYYFKGKGICPTPTPTIIKGKG